MKEECPTCCLTLTPSQLVANRALLGAINELLIKCPTTLNADKSSDKETIGDCRTENRRCQWKGYIKDVSAHMKSCKFLIDPKNEVIVSENIVVGQRQQRKFDDQRKEVHNDVIDVDVSKNTQNRKVSVSEDVTIDITEKMSLDNEDNCKTVPTVISLPDTVKMELHIHVDILLECCSYYFIEVSVHHLRQILEFLMDNDAVQEEVKKVSKNKNMKLLNIRQFASKCNSFLAVLTESVSNSTSDDRDNATKTLEHWTQVINTVLSTNVEYIHEITQLLLEVCANMSDVADLMSLKPSTNPIKQTSESEVKFDDMKVSDVNMTASSSVLFPNVESLPPPPLVFQPNQEADIKSSDVYISSQDSPSNSHEDNDVSQKDNLKMIDSNAPNISVTKLDDSVHGDHPTSLQSSMLQPFCNSGKQSPNLTKGSIDDVSIKNIDYKAECVKIGEADLRSRSPIELTVRELGERLKFSLKDTVFLLLEADDKLITSMSLNSLRQELCKNYREGNDALSANCKFKLSPADINALFQEVQKNLISLSSICNEGGLDADDCFLSDCIRSNGTYVVDWKDDSFVLKSDLNEVCSMLGIANTGNAKSLANFWSRDDSKDVTNKQREVSEAMTSTESVSLIESSNASDNTSDNVQDESWSEDVLTTPLILKQSQISMDDVNSLVMTVRELSSFLKLAVDDTIFLLLEAGDNLIKPLGLSGLRNQLEENISNNVSEKSPDCVVEVSRGAVETLRNEAENHLLSLTILCSEGGLDANICFLSDCLRSNGIHVIDWKGDCFVLKSDRPEVCAMLGIESGEANVSLMSSSSKPSQKSDFPLADTKYSSTDNSFLKHNVHFSNVDSVESYEEPPLHNNEKDSHQLSTDFDNMDQFDEAEYSAFAQNSPALSCVTSCDVEDMIQSGFSSGTWDSSLSDYISLQDLSCQWNINILGLITLAERGIIPVSSPSLEAFNSTLSGSVTHDWQVRNEELDVLLTDTQKKLFNMVHLADMFENIPDMFLLLSKAQIDIITWDEEKYILQADMEKAMDICINYSG